MVYLSFPIIEEVNAISHIEATDFIIVLTILPSIPNQEVARTQNIPSPTEKCSTQYMQVT
jgi:hypothetical protein